MSRDNSVWIFLGLLLVLVLPSVGLLPGTAAPDAFLAAALVVTAFFVLVAGPSVHGAGPARPLALLVAALPFLAYGVLESPTVLGTRPVPGAGFWVLAAVGIALPALERRWRDRIVAIVLTLVAGGALLAGAGLPLLPEVLDPLGAPTVWAGPTPDEVLAEALPPIERIGARRGAPVRTDGPFLQPATRGRFPDDARLYPVLGANGGLAPEGGGDGIFLPGREVEDVGSALELDTYDAIVVLPGAWMNGGVRAGRLAGALASYVRRGGLLVGPAPGRDWPVPLGQELGAAGRGWTVGLAGARTFGLGLVVRADSEAGIRGLLQAAEGRPRLATAFDGVDALPPPLPAPLAGWSDLPARRRPQGILLVVYVAVAALLDLILRGAGPRVMGLVAPALAVALGLVWTSPADPGVKAHALALDLGGGGGRRVEAIALSSGPRGWVGPCRFGGGGFLRLLGAHLGPDGLVRVPPGRTAWAVRETVAGGGGPTEPESRGAGFLGRLLRGRAEPARLRFGRGRPLDVDAGPATPSGTWILRYR